MDERTVIDTHGVEVFWRWWLVDDPRGLVVLSHGASEHSGRYDRFARDLGAAGFAAVALDHRGHGRTAPAAPRGVVGPGGGQALVDDLHELRAAASAEVGSSVPVVVFGHSLGSVIALAYLAQHAAGLAGAILCGFPVDPTGVGALAELLAPFADPALRDQSATDLLKANNAPFEPARTPFDWLSRDPAEVDHYLADPMCGDGNPLTYGYLLDLFDVAAPATQRLGDVTCPVLVIAGSQDPAAAMGAHARALADALDRAGVPVACTVYPDARHELLNETNRDQVTADVVAWLSERCPT